MTFYSRKRIWLCDLCCLNTAAVEVECYESDGDVQELSGNFMAMNETAISRM